MTPDSPEMNGRVIVTGAAGFIGGNLVRALNAQGASNILAVDHLGKSGKWRNLLGLDLAGYMEKDDFMSALLRGGVEKPCAVFHIGACSSTTEPDASYLFKNNTEYSRVLCEWALERGARFIYASSAATYGDGSLGYDDDIGTLENLRPLNMYGFSKHAFDLWAKRNKLFDRIVGLKYFNVFGPGEAHKGDMRSVALKAWEQIRAKGNVSLFKSHRPDYKNGEQRRDFIYVRDAVEATLFFARRLDVGGLFNCGSGEARTWLDLARAVFSAMNMKPDIRFIEMPDELRDKYQYLTQARVERLRAAGFDKPFTPLEDAVSDYVRRLQAPGA